MRFDGRIDGVSRDAEIDVAVLACLPAQERIDAPAARDAGADTSRVERIEHAQDLVGIHDPAHGDSLPTLPSMAAFDRTVLGP